MIGTVLLAVALGVAYVAQLVRWLRVLQREHYDAASLRRFVGRWAAPPIAKTTTPSRRANRRPLTLALVLPIIAIAACVVGQDVFGAVVAVVAGVFTPVGLGIRGRTSQLAWTRRLRAVATVSVVIALAIGVLGALTPLPWVGGVVAVLFVPPSISIANAILRPYEERAARAFVDKAQRRLQRVAPRVVAITGSYGKTSTKNHLAAMLAGRSVFATPRSFNNRGGLSRAVNEGLSDDVRVFIAEMGTYGPGEIEALCEWCPPEVAVVTAIGPVHLERMGSLDVIEQAKFEITGRATTVVLNADDERLASWVARLEASGKRVVRASSRNLEADVAVVLEGDAWVIFVHGDEVGRCPRPLGLHPGNVACAAAAALELGVSAEEVVKSIARLEPVQNRAVVATSESGLIVVDDTFNANPASARASLDLLAGLHVTGRRVVVTPGLIELGPIQHEENLVLARRAAALDLDLIVVGRTNAPALLSGFGERAMRVENREQAVEWVRRSLDGDDAVLYLNDLPDHYP